jgi:cellulose synthase/poly-beta-1,6-N-acetylglucosamine synthase-like glycosyltransferase
MKTIFFFFVAAVAAVWILSRLRRKPTRAYGSVDAIVPAFNEELCIVEAVIGLLENPYIDRVIVVNDGSTDGTAALIDEMASYNARVIPLHQANTGKGGALMAGIAKSQAPYVFLTDADTILPAKGDGLGYMIAELKRGADAVGGLPASNLKGAGLLPHIRATVKVPMIAMKRGFQQVLGGAPFLVSGSCGLFRREVLQAVPFSDRTKVEDLDLTWSLVAAGYKVRQTWRCVVYSQECNSLKAEWLRWRRWIIGYAVCMRLHRKLLLTRFGLFSILPMFLVAPLGIAAYIYAFTPTIAAGHPGRVPGMLFPLMWLGIVTVIALISAVHQRRYRLIPLAPAAVVYVLLAYAIWASHGLIGLITGHEPKRDKPKRYAHVVA